jgi:hypothetical protein|tara:strand:+ start:14 stop:349 length:336 start_codon:yes stop_codon:yes gene_type:complete
MGYMESQQSIYAHLQNIATDNKKLWSYSGKLSQLYKSELKLKEQSKKSAIDLDNKEALRQSVLEHLYAESSKGNAQASDKLARLAGLGEETQDIIIEVVNYKPQKVKNRSR